MPLRIVFTEAAMRDLYELRNYLRPVSASGLQRVTQSLENRIRLIADNPGLGRPTPREDIREAVEPKYGFLIPYLVRRESLFVLRVYRSARKPLDYAKL